MSGSRIHTALLSIRDILWRCSRYRDVVQAGRQTLDSCPGRCDYSGPFESGSVGGGSCRRRELCHLTQHERGPTILMGSHKKSVCVSLYDRVMPPLLDVNLSVVPLVLASLCPFIPLCPDDPWHLRNNYVHAPVHDQPLGIRNGDWARRGFVLPF